MHILWSVFLATLATCLALDETGEFRLVERIESPSGGSGFGTVVATQDDLVVVGSPSEQAVYVYMIEDGETSLIQILRGDTTAFGSSLAICGSRILIGATQVACLYEKQSNSEEYTLTQRLIPPTTSPLFASSVTLNYAEWIAIGGGSYTTDTGTVHIYKNDANGTFDHFQTLVPSALLTGSQFGASIAMKGDVMVVGDPQGHLLLPGSATMFKFREANNEWEQWGDSLSAGEFAHASDRFGATVDLSEGHVLVGAVGADPAFYSGAAYMFTLTDQGAQNMVRLIGSNTEKRDLFGASVALGESMAVVGALMKKEGYTFATPEAEVSGGTSPRAQPLGDDRVFGRSMSMGTSYFVVSAVSSQNRGVLYIFRPPTEKSALLTWIWTMALVCVSLTLLSFGVCSVIVRRRIRKNRQQDSRSTPTNTEEPSPPAAQNNWPIAWTGTTEATLQERASLRWSPEELESDV